MTEGLSPRGSRDNFSEYKMTSAPAICKILMITLAVPKVLCQPHMHVSLNNTSLKQKYANSSILINFDWGKLALTHWKKPCALFQRIQVIQLQLSQSKSKQKVRANPKANTNQTQTRNRTIIPGRDKMSGPRFWTLDVWWPEWAKHYKCEMRQHQGPTHQSTKIDSIDSTCHLTTIDSIDNTEFHQLAPTAMWRPVLVSKSTDAKPHSPALAHAVRSSSANSLQSSLASKSQTTNDDKYIHRKCSCWFYSIVPSKELSWELHGQFVFPRFFHWVIHVRAHFGDDPHHILWRLLQPSTATTKNIYYETHNVNAILIMTKHCPSTPRCDCPIHSQGQPPDLARPQIGHSTNELLPGIVLHPKVQTWFKCQGLWHNWHNWSKTRTVIGQNDYRPRNCVRVTSPSIRHCRTWCPCWCGTLVMNQPA